MLVNVGVCYGGRQEIVDAVRRYLQERFMERCSPEEILRELTPEALTNSCIPMTALIPI